MNHPNQVIEKPEKTQQKVQLINNAGLLIIPRSGVIGREVTFPAFYTLKLEQIQVRLQKQFILVRVRVILGKG